MRSSAKASRKFLKSYLVLGALLLFLPVVLFAVKNPTSLRNFASPGGPRYILEASYTDYLDVSFHADSLAQNIDVVPKFYVAEQVPTTRYPVPHQDKWQELSTQKLPTFATLVTTNPITLAPGRYWVMANLTQDGTTCTPNPTYYDEELGATGFTACSKDNHLVKTVVVNDYFGASVTPVNAAQLVIANDVWGHRQANTTVNTPLQVVVKSFMKDQSNPPKNRLRTVKLYYTRVTTAPQDTWTEIPLTNHVPYDYNYDVSKGNNEYQVATGTVTFPESGTYWVSTTATDAFGKACTGNPSYTTSELRAKGFTTCGQDSYIVVGVDQPKG